MQRNYACYSCEATSNEYIARHIDFGRDIFRCTSCGLLQTEYVSDELLSYYYDKIYRKKDLNKFGPTYFKFMEKRGIAQRKFVLEYSRQSSFGDVLDYGAGVGETIRKFSEISDSVYACEYDASVHQYLEKIPDITVLDPANVFTEKYHSYFDLLTISHVLEHLSNPEAFLTQAWHILKEDGLLFIEVPHQPSEIIDFVQGKLSTGEGHLFFYSPKTLTQLVEKVGGFEVVAIRQDGKSVSEYMDPKSGSIMASLEKENTSNGIWTRLLLRRNGKQKPKSRIGLVERLSARYEELERKIYDLNTETVIFEESTRRASRQLFTLLKTLSEDPSLEDAVLSDFTYPPNCEKSKNQLNQLLRELNKLGDSSFKTQKSEMFFGALGSRLRKLIG